MSVLENFSSDLQQYSRLKSTFTGRRDSPMHQDRDSALTFSLSSSCSSLLVQVAMGEFIAPLWEDVLSSHSLSWRESFMMTSSLAWIVSINIPSRSLSSPTLHFRFLTSCWRLSFSRFNFSSWLLRPKIWSSFWCNSSNVSLGTPSQRWLGKYLSYWEDRTVCCRSRTSSWELKNSKKTQ